MGEAEERKSPVGSKGQCPDEVTGRSPSEADNLL